MIIHSDMNNQNFDFYFQKTINAEKQFGIKPGITQKCHTIQIIDDKFRIPDTQIFIQFHQNEIELNDLCQSIQDIIMILKQSLGQEQIESEESISNFDLRSQSCYLKHSDKLKVLTSLSNFKKQLTNNEIRFVENDTQKMNQQPKQQTQQQIFSKQSPQQQQGQTSCQIEKMNNNPKQKQPEPVQIPTQFLQKQQYQYQPAPQKPHPVSKIRLQFPRYWARNHVKLFNFYKAKINFSNQNGDNFTSEQMNFQYLQNMQVNNERIFDQVATKIAWEIIKGELDRAVKMIAESAQGKNRKRNETESEDEDKDGNGEEGMKEIAQEQKIGRQPIQNQQALNQKPTEKDEKNSLISQQIKNEMNKNSIESNDKISLASKQIRNEQNEKNKEIEVTNENIASICVNIDNILVAGKRVKQVQKPDQLTSSDLNQNDKILREKQDKSKFLTSQIIYGSFNSCMSKESQQSQVSIIESKEKENIAQLEQYQKDVIEDKRQQEIEKAKAKKINKEDILLPKACLDRAMKFYVKMNEHHLNMKSVKSEHQQVKMEISQNSAMIKQENQEIENLQKQIQDVSYLICQQKHQPEYEEAENKIKSALVALDSVNQPQLDEFLKYIKPHKSAETVMVSILNLTNFYPNITCWNDIKKYVKNAHKFLKQLRKFDVSIVKSEIIDASKKIMSENKAVFDPKAIEKVSKPAKCLCEWFIQILNYYDAHRIIDPIRSKIQLYEMQIEEMESVIRIKGENVKFVQVQQEKDMDREKELMKKYKFDEDKYYFLKEMVEKNVNYQKILAQETERRGNECESNMEIFETDVDQSQEKYKDIVESK